MSTDLTPLPENPIPETPTADPLVPDALQPKIQVPETVSGLFSALDDKMGLELLEVSAERVVGRMPVEGNTQPFEQWHGGASCVLAETLASIGSWYAVQPGRVAVGVDLNATHHRPVTSGYVTGVATPLRIGQRVTSYDVVLTDDAGHRVCTARVTCQVVDNAYVDPDQQPTG